MSRVTYRFGAAWRALGITTVVVAIALELLIANEDGKFDSTGVATCAGVVGLGIWCYLYFRRYAITIDDEGLTLDCLWRQPMRIAWREISVIFLVIGWGCDLGVRNGLRSLPPSLRNVLMTVLALASPIGYALGSICALFSLLYLIMRWQEVHRFKKGLPPAD